VLLLLLLLLLLLMMSLFFVGVGRPATNFFKPLRCPWGPEHTP
jgi:hypothetical protein